MKFLLLIIMVPCRLFSQDFTGIWTGFLTAKQSRLPYELVISGERDNFSGYALTVFIINDIENTGIKSIKIKNKKSGIAIEDDELIFEDYKIASKKVTLYGQLSFEEGSTTVLQGTFFTRSADRSSYNGSIRMVKADDFAKTKLITHLEKLNLIGSLSFLKPKTTGGEINTDAITVMANESISPAQSNPPGEITTVHSLKEGQERVSLPVNTKPVLTNTPKSIQPTSNAINTFKATALPGQQTSPEDITREIALKGGQERASLPVITKPLSSPAPISIQPANNTVNTLKVAADLAIRKTEIIRSINFRSDSLVLSLYDNGEIDGDTVSVVVNDKVVIARRGLGTTAIKATVYVPGAADSLLVIMYAENLGRIAPNTGLLIVEDGTEKYQIRFEGDFQKNSAVIFRRRN